MTVTLELKPEVKAGLLAQAQARGVALDHYLEAVLEDIAQNNSVTGHRMTVEERAQAFEDWASSFASEAVIPDESLNRESLYPPRW
jgi:hypothetical protein